MEGNLLSKHDISLVTEPKVLYSRIFQDMKDEVP